MGIAIVAGIAGIAVGALAAWLKAGGKASALAAELARRESELAAERQARENDRAASERLNAEREKTFDAERAAWADKIAAEKRSQDEFKEHCRQVLQEREKTVNERLEQMMAAFKNSAAETLAEREKTLNAKNAEQLGALLAPMRQKLEDFRSAAEESKKKNGELGVKIEDFFKNIRDVAHSFGAEAKSFTNALRGANKKQGNWGEAILAQTLVDCGLQDGKTFVTQTGSGEGIPDAQVFDYGSSRAIVVDAKMSWTKYEEAYKLPDGPERAEALKEHVASVKRHVDELAKADYPHKLTPPIAGFGYVPITVMFVPCTAALEAALETEPGLMDFAFKRNVALATPLTLFGLLILVSRAWSNYAADKNSAKILEEAKKLVRYVDGLFAALEELGNCLGKAQKSHETVMKLAAREPSGQCILGPAERICRLGGKPEKFKAKTTADALALPEP